MSAGDDRGKPFDWHSTVDYEALDSAEHVLATGDPLAEFEAWPSPQSLHPSQLRAADRTGQRGARLLLGQDAHHLQFLESRRGAWPGDASAAYLASSHGMEQGASMMPSQASGIRSQLDQLDLQAYQHAASGRPSQLSGTQIGRIDSEMLHHHGLPQPHHHQRGYSLPEMQRPSQLDGSLQMLYQSAGGSMGSAAELRGHQPARASAPGPYGHVSAAPSPFSEWDMIDAAVGRRSSTMWPQPAPTEPVMRMGTPRADIRGMPSPRASAESVERLVINRPQAARIATRHTAPEEIRRQEVQRIKRTGGQATSAGDDALSPKQRRRIMTRQAANQLAAGQQSLEKSADSMEDRVVTESPRDVATVHAAVSPDPFVLSDPKAMRTMFASASKAWGQGAAKGGTAGPATEAQRSMPAQRTSTPPASGFAPSETALASGPPTSASPGAERPPSAGSPTIATSQHGNLTHKSTVGLLAVAAAAADSSDRACTVRASWERLLADVKSQREAYEKAASSCQAYEQQVNAVLLQLEGICSPVALPIEKRKHAMQLLAVLNPDAACRASTAAAGKRMAMFCSKLEMAPGWDKQALRPVLDSLSDKQDVPKVCHVVTVGSAAGQSRTLEQLCNLRLAELQSLYRDHAAELSSLLPQALAPENQEQQGADRRMAELAQDLSVLMLAAVCSRPTEVLMMALSRDDPTEEPPSELWATVVDAADFSEAQRAQICSLYDASTTMLAEVRAKRECLRHEIAALLKGNGSASAAAPDASHKEMLEYVSRLRQGCEAHSTTIFEFGASLLLGIASPLQAARMVGRAHPHVIQPLKIAAAIANGRSDFQLHGHSGF